MSQDYKFEIGVRIPMRGLLPSVKDLEDGINKTMEGFGFSEKMTVTSVLPMMLTLGRQLTDKEMQAMLEVIRSQFQETYKFAKIEYCKAV